LKKLIIFVATLVVCSLIYKGTLYTQTKVHMGDWQASGKIESLTELGLKETTNTATPATNFGVIRAKSDGKLYYENDAGTESDLTAGAAGGDSVSVDGVAVVDPDFVSTGDIDFVDTSNTITANINADKITEAMLNAIDAPAGTTRTQAIIISQLFDKYFSGFTFLGAKE
jgi:hypothetical protein